jgi:26S proteasome regulatory subunit N1
MALRTMNHLMQLGSKTVKRTVPIALAIMHLSNPKINIQDLLSKLAHSDDE